MHLRLNTLLARLLLGAGFPLVLFAAVVFVAAIAIARLNTALWWEQHSHQVIEETLRMQQNLTDMRLAHLSEALVPFEGLDKEYQDNRQAFRRRATELRDQVRDEQGEGGDDQNKKMQNILDGEEEWHDLVADTRRALAPAPGQTREELQKLAKEHFDQTRSVSDRIQDDIDAFLKTEEALLARRRDQAAALTTQSTWMIGVTATTALVLALLVALTAARSVTRPIQRLREAASKLLAGRFEIVPPDGPTEIAELAVHFNHMGITLSQHTSSLEQQKERYQQYIGATSHLLWSTDANGSVVTDLPTWRAYTGQGETDIRGVGWLDAVHAEERETIRAAWAAAVRDRTLFESECRLRGREGNYRHFSCRAVPIVRPDGTVSEWIGTCTDVTEKKQQAELQRAMEAAEASSRAKSEFLAKMSHELRTPLNAIIGMSRMLATQRFGSLNAKQADYLKDVVQAGEHLLNLINDILDIAKVESGRMDLHAEPFGLDQDVSTLLATLRPLAEEKKLALRFEPPQPDGQLATDRGRFRQVLYNLLSNAIKFTPNGGSVTVACQWVAGPAPDAAVVPADEAAAVRVAVRDTGVGIAPEDQALIWDEFRQARLPSGAGGQGTGLGLALTRKLVGLLGGAVWLESAAGQGSTFTFVLPRELPQAPPPPEDAPAGDGRKPLILVIEDYPPTRKLLLDWLAEDGLATAWAGDGESGLEMARRLRPRLILLDLMLPKLDGWEVLTELKSHPETASIPVVIVSVNEGRLPSGYLDVQEYFVKPLERDSFLRRLRESHPNLFNRGQSVAALVVDDDPVARKLLSDLLRAEQIDVVEAADGAEALRLLDARRPDFILVDLLMPGMDGFDVVDAVRGRPDLKDLPILVVSSKDLTAEDRKRLNGNVQALVAKRELTPEDLHRRLRGLGLSAGAKADAGADSPQA